LVRAKDLEIAKSRVLSSLSSKGLSLSNAEKLIAVPSDLSRPDLGLSSEMIEEVQRSLTSVIHSAWSVNFNLGVSSFEAQHIRGTKHLIDLCLRVPFAQPARFSFVSSISAAAGTPIPARIPETYIENPAHAQGMGYARSKWVTESIIRIAAKKTGMSAKVLRTGQIIGDSLEGHWNDTEAIPLMIRAATTIGALPMLEETPSWLPVDKCAQAIIELSDAGVPFTGPMTVEDTTDVVYHVQNPHTFHWTSDLLPALAKAGLQFESVGQREWIQRLREGEQDPKRNPTVKLVDFFTEKYDNDGPARKGLVFETGKTQERSETIQSGFDVINSGLIAKCVDKWRQGW
jgi:thioester reductase-like protein